MITNTLNYVLIISFLTGIASLRAMEAPAESELSRKRAAEPSSEPSAKRSILLPPSLAQENPIFRLYKAVSENNSAMIVSLLQQTKTNVEGLSPLHLAVVTGNTEAVKALIIGASLEHTTPMGNTPLHSALFQNHVEIAHILIDTIVKTNNKQLLNKKNKRNVTPLMVAAHISLPTTIPVIERLLDLKVDQTGYLKSLPPFMRAIMENRESDCTNNK